jgi:dTDP-4-dehydrorhamnose reductase
LKILLFGKDGQVGWELQRSLAPLGELVALGSSHGELAVDFSYPSRLAQTVEIIKPDIVVNAAAYTAVDKAESERALAYNVNAEAPGALARAADAIGALLVHFSTDYVFDGSGTSPRTEEDIPGPLNVYGETKLEGERLIRQHCANHLILRTSWVYSARGGNFAKTMLRLAQEREQLSVVADQMGVPTGADLIADVTAHAIRSAGACKEQAGLYHLVAKGETSWHEYAQFVLQTARDNGIALKTREVVPVPSTAFTTVARRPMNSRLATQKIREQFRVELPQWQIGVSRMLQELS